MRGDKSYFLLVPVLSDRSFAFMIYVSTPSGLYLVNIPDSTSVIRRFRILYNQRNLGHHIVDILEHGAFGGSQVACPFDMLDDLLVLLLDIVKKLADCL